MVGVASMPITLKKKKIFRCWKNVEVMQVLRNLLLHVESLWGYWYEVYNAVI